MPRVSAVNRRYRFTRPSFKPQGLEGHYIEYLRSIRGPLSYLNTLDTCEMCAMALVQIAKQCCCQPCFVKWLFLEDGTKCDTCEKPLKDLLTREQANKFCERTGLNWKRSTESEHVLTNLIIERRIRNMAQKTSN